MADTGRNGQDPDSYCTDCGANLGKGEAHDPTCEWA